MFQLRLVHVAFACAAGVAAGCGGDRLETVQVNGIVTCQGKPVSNAQVMFSPQEIEGREATDLGKAAVGLTDEQGRFTLSTYGDDDGVVAARHAVSVSLLYDEEAEDAVDPNETFPCNGKTTEVTVGADTKDVKVEL